VHIQELTQPQGHSTSGSHERYKTKERLEWEAKWDCLLVLRSEVLLKKLVSENELTALEDSARKEVEKIKSECWEKYLSPLNAEKASLVSLLEETYSTLNSSGNSVESVAVKNALSGLQNSIGVSRKSFGVALHSALIALRNLSSESQPAEKIRLAYKRYLEENSERYCSHLHSEANTKLSKNPNLIPEVKVLYSANPESVDGRVVLLKCFESIFEKYPTTFALGEDVGKLGDVNLVFEGLQAKFGELRISDTGIREATILGQGIGAALRGLRPLVDIQYLDYLLYALQLMSDDLACLHYRTRGGQKAPVIMRTKGHRLEGVWHTGSPIGMILSSVRGMYVCVPRNCTQAAGLYNTLIQGDNPALVIEVLNAYRNKEFMPENIGEFSVPLGLPEVLLSGNDITLVTYGACIKVAQEAISVLEGLGISVELIDVQTLLPFDTHQIIRKSIEKTSAVLFFDEDVPGSASAYMYQQVIENQNTFDLLDVPPATLCAEPNRSPYGSDGDYFVKPNTETLVSKVYGMLRQRDSQRYPKLF
jgi:pyruvate/2-oxoglutarate/acetoin dehydrogenase E1 component